MRLPQSARSVAPRNAMASELPLGVVPDARIIDALVALTEQHCEGRVEDDVAIVALRYSGPEEHSSTGLQEW
jgi:hypothetical protein